MHRTWRKDRLFFAQPEIYGICLNRLYMHEGASDDWWCVSRPENEFSINAIIKVDVTTRYLIDN